MFVCGPGPNPIVKKRQEVATFNVFLAYIYMLRFATCVRVENLSRTFAKDNVSALVHLEWRCSMYKKQAIAGRNAFSP